MIVEDGKGRGYRMGITNNNRAMVEAVTSSTEHTANHDYGLAYQLPFEQSPTAGDDCIFYVSNDSQIDDMVIEGIDLSVSAACEIYFQINDKGTRNAATDLTPVNLNGGSGNSAVGTFERGADLDGGAATLAGGAEFERLVFRAATDTAHHNFEQDIILPRNATMTIWCNQAAPTINGTLVFNYHEIED